MRDPLAEKKLVIVGTETQGTEKATGTRIRSSLGDLDPTYNLILKQTLHLSVFISYMRSSSHWRW